MENACPGCKSRNIRRRRRSGIFHYALSAFGKWPYRCEKCGNHFLLRKRYVRPLNGVGYGPDGPLFPPNLPILEVPVGGVASGQEVQLPRVPDPVAVDASVEGTEESPPPVAEDKASAVAAEAEDEISAGSAKGAAS